MKKYVGRRNEYTRKQTGDPIIKSDFEITLKQLDNNNNKLGMDEIQAKILIFASEGATKRLCKLVSSLYEIAKLPDCFKKSTTVTLLKNSFAQL